MLGAICGDIIGSRFEFDRGPWTKNFELFIPESTWTDDTVMAEGMYDIPVEVINKVYYKLENDMVTALVTAPGNIQLGLRAAHDYHKQV